MTQFLSSSSQVPLLIAAELEQAGISYNKDLFDKSVWFNGEPEGKLGSWLFKRLETSWLATAPEGKGIPITEWEEFINRWQDAVRDRNEVDVPGIPGNPSGKATIDSISILRPSGLITFALLIQAPTKEEALKAEPTKPPLYQTIVDMIEHMAAKIEKAPTRHDMFTEHNPQLNGALCNSSFPDPTERAWILAKLEEIEAKYPAASKFIGLDETIELFKK